MSRTNSYGAVVGLLSMMLVVASCASSQPKPQKPVYVEAEETPEPPKVPKVVAVPVATPVPGQLRPAPRMTPPNEEEIEEAKKRSEGREVWEVIDEANEEAKANPVEDGFYNAVQVYDFSPGALYQVYAAPMKLTAIQLGQGEKIVSVASGDTVRWVIGETASGEGSDLQQLILVKPVRSGLHTNMVVTTDRRVYQLELHSYRETYMASVSWNYPYDMVKRYEGNASEDKEAADSTEAIAVNNSVEKLDFEYRFVVEDKDDVPTWMPRRVYNDGLKTYIQFPTGVREQEMPALFVLSKKGKPQIVNFRVRGDYIVVDRLVELAQLRLGEDDPVTVGIEKIRGD